MKRKQLEGDQPLIVVRCKRGVEVALDYTMEERLSGGCGPETVATPGPGEKSQGMHGGGDDLDLLATKIAVSPACGFSPATAMRESCRARSETNKQPADADDF